MKHANASVFPTSVWGADDSNALDAFVSESPHARTMAESAYFQDMAIGPGTRIGPYEVLALLGAGGMGEVYRARDPRLGRDVALKVLPDSFTMDTERVARFRREAQVLAALNHPHIAAIHGLEDANGLQTLVLELVEGPTLADRLTDGPIPLDETLPIARQIAEALEAAHEQGIVHRDLKPANIKITSDGVVKVLDFGLAKSSRPNVNVPNDPNNPNALTASPTITSPAMMTGVGTILGTAAYMAPEQAKGRPADKRCDVWSFGCVLYEMLTGRRAFEGEDISDTLAAVLRGEPDFAALPASTPLRIQRLLRACLQKDRRQRISDIAVARYEVDEALHGQDIEASSLIRPRIRRWRAAAAAAVLLALGGAIVGAAVWLRMRPTLPEVIRFDVAPSSSAAFTVGPAGPNLVVSPDGNRIVYHVRRGDGALDMRTLEQLESQPLAGTERATNMSFSPDGRSLAFVRDRRLYRLSFDLNTVAAVCEMSGPAAGTTWLDADTIVFAQLGGESGLYRVAAAGGQPERIVRPDQSKGESLYAWPDALPGGTIVFNVARAEGGTPPQIAVRALGSGEQKTLMTGTFPRFAATGHLLFMQGAQLMAVPFDVSGLETTGMPAVLQDGVITKGTLIANYDVADAGTLVYAPGTGVTYATRFVWRDRNGALVGPATVDRLESPRYPRLSPNGRRLAATVGPAQAGNVWIFDLTSANQPLKVTFKAHNIQPTWSPDGSRVIFASNQDGLAQLNLYTLAADGSQLAAERITSSGDPQTLPAWSPDGGTILFQTGGAIDSRSDLAMLAASGDRMPKLWVQTMFYEGEPSFSPDGRWVAYVSDQTGAAEVWVRPFPGPGSPVRLSPNGGRDPMWSRNGRELFYQEGNKLMAAAIMTTGGQLRFTTPQMLFEGGFIPWEPNTPRTYDVAPDGRFLMLEQPPGYFSQRFAVVVNWGEELKRRLPTN